MSQEQHVRDSALLAILLQTGHRASEVAGLCWKHATVRKGLVTLFFERCKGNKTAQDELSKEASTALLRWLHMHYGRILPGWQVIHRCLYPSQGVRAMGTRSASRQ